MERIDTHETVKNLIASGLPEKQAEAITKAINTSENLATKEDMIKLRGEINLLGSRFVALEGKVIEKFLILENKIDKTLGWGMTFIVGIILLLLALAAEIALIGWYK